MHRARHGLAVLGFYLAGLANGAAAQNGGMCHAPDPVLVVLVESAPKVGPAAAGLSRTPVLVEASDTVIYADGRAVTSDLAAISQHLNALGWAQRKIEIIGAGTSTRMPPATRTKRRG
jgi:hypothetical protein